MPSGKNLSIKYTNREFDSIKDDLISYAKKYYPDQFKDFNEGSFGSLMVDLVSYIGDSLSFALDYHVNESFLENSFELKNVLRHARSLGYKHKPVANSFGVVDLYVLVRANTATHAPITDYLPTVKRGTVFSTPGGKNFTLAEDVNFASSNTIYKVAKTDTNKIPTYFVLKNSGQVISGDIVVKKYEVGEFIRFHKISLGDENITEILSVIDTEGNEYFEVDYLSQDVVYRTTNNSDPSTELDAPSVLKPMTVPRRFSVERDEFNVPFMQFGTVSNNDVLNKDFVDPNEVVMQLHAKDYISDNSYDPNNMFSNDKFGIGPSDTTLTVVYRTTNVDNVNASANSITQIVDAEITFKNEVTIPSSTRIEIISSLEVDNPSPIIGDVSEIEIAEAKTLAYDSYATQNRAVTKNDYISLIYRMPRSLGAIKRTNVFQDNDAFKRNINVYVLSEDTSDNLIRTPAIIKKNLKSYLNLNKMINDSIDILDAHVVNIGIDFTILAQENVDKHDALVAALSSLKNEIMVPKMNIGEPFYITEVYRILKEVDEVLDVVDVKINNKTSSNHSGVYYNIKQNTSSDGRIVNSKENICFEIKFGDDIKGAVI
tara:strand:- start:1245 stop:3044 length:1800 start_codon:yes stop_codon:yes gene_type:complete